MCLVGLSWWVQDERVRLSEQLAAVMAELRQATEANRQRQELNSQVGKGTPMPGFWPDPGPGGGGNCWGLCNRGETTVARSSSAR
jgi:hypothetical protein